MAGTTLRGIGDDEEEEGAGEKTPPPPGQEEPQPLSGPTVVDSAKVAESLKKLRSLDDYPKTPPPTVIASGNPPAAGAPPPALGPLSGPPTTATLMGLPLTLPSRQAPAPAVGTGTLFGIGAPNLSGSNASPPISHTLAGVVAPVDAENEATIPTNAVSGVIEPDVRGTMMGHDRHLGEHVPAEGGRVERAPTGEFSGGERHFFESEPINTEYEPEFKPNPYARVGVALAVAGVFVAAVWGYVRYRRFEPAPTEAQTSPAPAEPAAPAAAAPPAPAPTPPPPPVTAQEPHAPATPPPSATAPTPTPAPTPSEPTPAPAASATAAAASPAATPPAAPKEEPAPPPPAPTVAEPPPAKHASSAITSRPSESAKEEKPMKETKEPKAGKETTATVEKPRPRAPAAVDRPKALKEPTKEKDAALATPSFAPTPAVRKPVRPVTTLEPMRPGTASKPALQTHEPPFATGAKARPAPVLPGQTIPVPPRPKSKRMEEDPDGTLPLSID